jgi:hypothetical protein
MSAASHERLMGNQEVAGIGLDAIGAFVTAWNLFKLNAWGILLGLGIVGVGEWLRRRGKKHSGGGH